MKLYKLILLLISISVFTSCEKFLDEKPSKNSSLVPKTVEQLDYLFNNYSTFAEEGNKEIIFGTDDFGLITDIYDARSSIYSPYIVQYATWDEEYLENYDRPYWPTEWKKIFTANLVLQKIDDVSGSEEDKARLMAEAHFVRVYSYFQLANTYCLPNTEENAEELGLPLKTSTSFEETVKRSSLADTWSFMEADLQKALEIGQELDFVNNKYRSWRANKAAVYGFAARFYLSMHDYETALSYAEDALAEHNELRDYNTDMYYSNIVSEVTIYDPDPQTVTIDYPYTHDSQSDPTDMMEWEESYYYRYLYVSSWWYIPSIDLLDLYDQTYDLRYKYHMVERYSYDRGIVNPPLQYPGYIFFFKDKILNGPSVPEMLLTKAECQIRTGQWQDGLNTANLLRAVRIDQDAPSDIIELSASSQAEALIKVLEERRREMPFITRWYDVRRFNTNDNPDDDVVMTRTFYPYNASAVLGGEPPVTYTLDKNSRRYANPLPITDIIASQGELEQNEY